MVGHRMEMSDFSSSTAPGSNDPGCSTTCLRARESHDRLIAIDRLHASVELGGNIVWRQRPRQRERRRKRKRLRCVRAPEHRVTSLEALRAITGDAHEAIINKHSAWLTPFIREYIAASPFFLLATSDADGNCDVTPRGDTTSVVQILDDETIVIPDRPGNRRVDSFRNILANPHVGLLFLIPGIEEALCINGGATITSDPELLA